MYTQQVARLDTGVVYVFWLNASLSFFDVGLGPPVHIFSSVNGHERTCDDELFDPDGFDLDEAGGVGGFEATKLVHGGLNGIVETLSGDEKMLSDVPIWEP